MLNWERAGAILSLFMPAVWQEPAKSSSPFPQILWDDCEKKQKGQQFASALEQLRLRRDDIRREGPERYDSLWKSKGREDSESRSWIDFATNTVRFTLGDVDAELFRNDANFRKVPGDSRHRDYDQMLLNLEQYEMRLRKLIGE